jgi:hypothetical protein
MNKTQGTAPAAAGGHPGRWNKENGVQRTKAQQQPPPPPPPDTPSAVKKKKRAVAAATTTTTTANGPAAKAGPRTGSPSPPLKRNGTMPNPTTRPTPAPAPAMTRGKSMPGGAMVNPNGRRMDTNDGRLPSRNPPAAGMERKVSMARNPQATMERKVSVSFPPATTANQGRDRRAGSLPAPSPTPTPLKHKAGSPNHNRQEAVPSSPRPIRKYASAAVPRPPSTSVMQAPPRPASLVYEDMRGNKRNTNSNKGRDTRAAALQRSKSASPAMPAVTRKKSTPNNTTPTTNNNKNANAGVRRPSSPSAGNPKNVSTTNGGPHQYQPVARTKSLQSEDDESLPSSPMNPIQGLVARTLSLVEEAKERLLGDHNSRTAQQQQQQEAGTEPPNTTTRKASIVLTSPPENLPPPPNRTASFVPGAAYFGSRSDHSQSVVDRNFFGGGDDILSASERAEEAAAFPDDARWQRALRYIRLLPATPDEPPIKRRIRIFIWCSLFFDFICCIVAITTYSCVSTCCGRPIWNVAGIIDWNKAVKAISIIYIVAIFLEVIPVVREGVPLNMLNPLLGFLISFAVFFDNSRAEAIVMWVFEVMAVIFEYLVYRSRYVLYRGKKLKIDEIDAQLEPYIVARKARKLAANQSQDSFDSFGDDDEEKVTEDYREIRLLRDRRYLRSSLATERKHLRYHLVGVIFNSVLIFITLMVVIFIARSGGLCISDYETPNPFAKDQFAKCSSCLATTGTCEICTDATTQCYYPYY